jgi:16S rRNA (cytidine1402-2'-O)-methyltransferase
LGDIVPRAIEVLQSVDVIAAEDTRHSRRLTDHFGIDTPLIAYHDHSGAAAIQSIVNRLIKGQQVALISDAGTPLISDPGYRIVDAAHTAGIPVVPIPGASAVIAALSAAGLPSDRFVFEGFLPQKKQARLNYLETLSGETRTLIFYEAPHRVLACLEDMVVAFGGDRQAVMAREITKAFETIKRLPLAELAAWVGEDSNQRRGECVLLIQGAEKETGLTAETTHVMDVLRNELPLKQASSLASKITGVKKNQLYQYGLDQQE